MRSTQATQRLFLIVVDGLRAEAIDRVPLRHLSELMANGAATSRATTVLPSVTAAAMTSLYTGVTPERHGVGATGFVLPRQLGRLQPLTRLLYDAGISSDMYIQDVPQRYRMLGSLLGHFAGYPRLNFGGDSAREIVGAAQLRLRDSRQGLIFMHWPDADVAGHRHGWASAEYEEALRRMDDLLGELVEAIDLGTDDGTVLAVCSDHGGGGVDPRDHDSRNALDITIPIVLAGRRIARTDLGSDVTLLDLPPTILRAFDLPIPERYEGKPLERAFHLASAA